MNLEIEMIGMSRVRMMMMMIGEKEVGEIERERRMKRVLMRMAR